MRALPVPLANPRPLGGVSGTSNLLGVSPTDPLTPGAVVLIVLTVSGLATLIPATRGTLVEPIEVLRDE